jgi:hypothetical protein
MSFRASAQCVCECNCVCVCALLSVSMTKRQGDLLSFKAKVWSRETKKILMSNRTDNLPLAGDNIPNAETSAAGAARTPAQSPEPSDEARTPEAVQDALSLDIVQVRSGNDLLDLHKRQQALVSGQRFQENWAYQFPWCQELVRPNGEVAQVQCMVCTRIEGTPKILKAVVGEATHKTNKPTQNRKTLPSSFPWKS